MSITEDMILDPLQVLDTAERQHKPLPYAVRDRLTANFSQNVEKRPLGRGLDMLIWQAYRGVDGCLTERAFSSLAQHNALAYLQDPHAFDSSHQATVPWYKRSLLSFVQPFVPCFAAAYAWMDTAPLHLLFAGPSPRQLSSALDAVQRQYQTASSVTVELAVVLAPRSSFFEKVQGVYETLLQGTPRYQQARAKQDIVCALS
jgi:hypothetical protein